MNIDAKKEVARRQLGTALALFLADEDPVSVHCLACGGGEIAEHLASRAGETSFAQHALDIYPEMDTGELKRLKNKYWNAMKHSTSHSGKPRDDDDLLSAFNDEHNDHVLFIGWYDYASAIGTLPIEVQVFQVWYFANFPDKLQDRLRAQEFENFFPKVSELSRAAKKRQLRRKIEWARNNREVMTHVKTERRKLVLGRSVSLTDPPLAPQ